MLVCKKLLLPFAFACCGALFAQNIQNPVLPGVADAGVMKYNGKYYIGGVRTNGDFYVSDDLVHWGKPIHVVSMDNDWTRGSGAGNDQIHANDYVLSERRFSFVLVGQLLGEGQACRSHCTCAEQRCPGRLHRAEQEDMDG